MKPKSKEVPVDWLGEVEKVVSHLFPLGFFRALRMAIDKTSGEIVDISAELRSGVAVRRAVLDAASLVELRLAQAELDCNSEFAGLEERAREKIGGRTNKDQVFSHVLKNNPKYASRERERAALKVLHNHLQGDSYGKGGLKEAARMRNRDAHEISRREMNRMGEEED